MTQLFSMALFGLAAACGGTSERQPAPPAPPSAVVTADDLTDPPDMPDTAPPQTRPAPPNAVATLLPPGVTAAAGRPLGPGEAALSFNSRTPPAALLAWYHSPERSGAFHVESELTEGAEKVLSGTLAHAPGDFTVRIAPGEHGGTTAMVLVTGR
jgi:hypothetical protein